MKFLFYLFATVVIYAALRVVTARNPVVAVMHLVLAFCSSSALWMLLQAEFLALSLVVVYVGAVMVLFLFVVMMLDINDAVVRAGFTRYLPVGIVIGLIIVAEFALVYLSQSSVFSAEFYPLPASLPVDYSNTKELGQLLYTQYLYPFEVVAVILLVALVAAISLVQRPKRANNRSIPVEQQLATRREDCIRLVDMPSSERQAPLSSDSDIVAVEGKSA